MLMNAVLLPLYVTQMRYATTPFVLIAVRAIPDILETGELATVKEKEKKLKTFFWMRIAIARFKSDSP